MRQGLALLKESRRRPNRWRGARPTPQAAVRREPKAKASSLRGLERNYVPGQVFNLKGVVGVRCRRALHACSGAVF